MFIQIIPVDDLLDHWHSSECPCAPVIEWLDPETELPHNAPLVIHNAADGREHAERLIGEGLGPHKRWANIRTDNA